MLIKHLQKKHSAEHCRRVQIYIMNLVLALKGVYNPAEEIGHVNETPRKQLPKKSAKHYLSGLLPTLPLHLPCKEALPCSEGRTLGAQTEDTGLPSHAPLTPHSMGQYPAFPQGRVGVAGRVLAWRYLQKLYLAKVIILDKNRLNFSDHLLKLNGYGWLNG